jgi:tetratricopeptide (TPR) repeat protein
MRQGPLCSAENLAGMHKRWIFLAALTMWGAVSAPLLAMTGDEMLAAFYRGEYAAIRAPLENWMAVNPNDAHGAFFLARTYGALGMDPQAKAMFARSAELYRAEAKERESKQVQCFADMLYGATSQVRWDRADDYIDDYDSGEFAAYLARGRENAAQSRFGPAADDFTKAEEILGRLGNMTRIKEAQVGRYLNRGLATTGQESVDAFQRAIQLDPDNPHIFWLLGDRFYASNRDSEAVNAYRHAADMFAARGDLTNRDKVLALSDVYGRHQREAEERARKLEETRYRVLGTWRNGGQTLNLNANQTYTLWTSARSPRTGGWRVLDDGRVQLFGAGGNSDWYMEPRGTGWVSINGATWNK